MATTIVPPTNKGAPVAPRPASTVLLLRDGPRGIEVFMVVRHRAIEFASGAMVFPGGKVEPADGAAEVQSAAHGLEGLSAEEAAFRVAAVREIFEEAGVLLARPTGSAEFVAQDAVDDLVARFRAPLEKDEKDIADLIAAADIELACEMLVPFAHWVTPRAVPKRFDTRFFATAMPPNQEPAHDGGETVASRWVRPADALAEAEAGRATLVFATKMNLRLLAESATVDEALAAAAKRRIVCVEPEVTEVEGGFHLRIPAEAGYGLTEDFVRAEDRAMKHVPRERS